MSQKETKGKKLSLREVFRSPNTIRVLICVLGTAVIIGLFEVAIVPMRYNLQVGMVPTTTISATKDVVDELSTEQRRKEAAAQVTPTYRYQEGITEQLKAQDQMAWVGLMNGLRNQAEEMILTELIYA